MNILKVTKDGGPLSRVWAYWLIEIKRLFSVVLLRFEDGTRDVYHSHAFNSIAWVLRGKLREEFLDGRVREHLPSLRPFRVGRDDFHQVKSIGRTWVFNLRGPWTKTWLEYNPVDGKTSTLTNGRVECTGDDA